jgi:hypothetical protein
MMRIDGDEHQVATDKCPCCRFPRPQWSKLLHRAVKLNRRHKRADCNANSAGYSQRYAGIAEPNANNT